MSSKVSTASSPGVQTHQEGLPMSTANATQLLIVVSGLSGSGISTALEALEDQGYFCVDNLPPPLINKLAELASGTPNSAPLAIGLDARSIHDEESSKAAVDALEELKQCGYTHQLVFLEAAEEILLKRFSTSRRSHPLSHSHSRTPSPSVFPHALPQCLTHFFSLP